MLILEESKIMNRGGKNSGAELNTKDRRNEETKSKKKPTRVGQKDAGKKKEWNYRRVWSQNE